MAKLSAELVLGLTDRVSKNAKTVAKSLDQLDNRVGSMSSRLNATTASAMAQLGTFLGPAALAYGAAKAYTRFASVERSINRIGITAGATAEQTKAAFSFIDKVAFDHAISQDSVVAGLDSMVASGRTMESALSFLPAVAATAQAAGAEITDIATTADALSNSFGIVGSEMQGAFDILVKAGKEGKFELRDMAAYIPTLGPAFEALGYKGTDGVKKLAAALQVVRQRTGSAGEAATAFSNVLQKMETEETAKKFKSFGIDLRKEMANARAEGKDLLQVFIDLSTKALKGDLSKLPQLFGDAQVISGMRALIAGGDEMSAMFGRLGNAAGETKKDLDAVLGDSQAKIDRMGTSWDKLMKSVGGGVANVANPALDWINADVDNTTARDAGYEKARVGGQSNRDINNEYFAKYREVYPETGNADFYNPASQFNTDRQQALMDVGRGSAKTIYDGLNRIAEAMTTKRFPSAADGQAASDALKARQAGNIDGGDITKGTPAPRFRPREGPAAQSTGMSIEEQRRQYDNGRRAGEAVMRERLENMPVRIRDFSEPGSGGWRDGAPVESAPRPLSVAQELAGIKQPSPVVAPPAPPQVRVGPSPREAESASMLALMQQFGALLAKGGTSFQPGTTGRDVTDEAGLPQIAAPTVDLTAVDAAKAAAAMAGTEMQASLSINAAPTISTASIDAFMAKVRAAKAALNDLGTVTAAATARALPAGNNLYSDIER